MCYHRIRIRCRYLCKVSLIIPYYKAYLFGVIRFADDSKLL